MMGIEEEEEKENPCAAFQKGKRFGEWVIHSKLDEGGFGQVYKVESIRIPGKVAALKAEPNDVEGGSAIKLEMHVLKMMHADGEKIHIPTVFHAAKHKKFCYMVMMLLGENLKHLKSQNGDKFSPGTWSRLAIQCLYGIKLVHDYGFIHRDIKPNNFVMGHPNDVDRCRIVHILDFGLTRSYATKSANGQWVQRRARGTAEFRGTLRYCSPNVHMKKEQGRIDDLWGLLYVLVEANNTLPWQKEYDKKKVESMKMVFDGENLMKDMPIACKNLPFTLKERKDKEGTPMEKVIQHNCYTRPDYLAWFKAFRDVMAQEKVLDEHWKRYDWEKPEMEQELKKRYEKAVPKWLSDGEAFFSYDPIKIDGPLDIWLQSKKTGNSHGTSERK